MEVTDHVYYNWKVASEAMSIVAIVNTGKFHIDDQIDR